MNFSDFPVRLRSWVRGRLGLAQTSYAQCGEDLIVDAVFRGLHIDKPSYMDIGAYDPRQMSNTYLFYKRGARGVCIEPQPLRCARIRRVRPKDLCLNIGVGGKDHEGLEFYILSQEALSTFSKTEAERVCRYGNTRIERKLKIPVMTLTAVLKKHQLPAPDYISIDLEGDELEALQTLDWAHGRPKVICAETLTYTEDRTEQKQQKTIDWLEKKGYFLYADTYINSIFVDKALWKNR
jgi:FkbM family methyltransferase